MRGGKRKGAGRPKGAVGKKKQALGAALQKAAAGLKGDFTSLQLLQAIYRNAEVPVPVRVSAAQHALPFEHARQSNVKVGGDGGAVTVEVVRFTDAPSK